MLLSIDGRVLAINKAARGRLARRSAGAEPLGAHLDQLLPHDLAKARLSTVREVAASATSTHLENSIRARCFEFWYYPVRHPDQPVSEVAVYAREITERKRAETQLRRLYQAMQQSPASVIITDLKGRIVYVNPKFTEVTGYTCDEVIGKKGSVLKAVGIAVRSQLPPGAYIELFVKVDKDWQRRPKALERLGY